MYTEPDKFASLAKKNKVDYVYISSYERSQFKTDGQYFRANYPLAFQSGEVEIFAVSDRAKNSISGTKAAAPTTTHEDALYKIRG